MDSNSSVFSYDDYKSRIMIPESYSNIYDGKRKVICFTHSEDFDGIFSSEIVKRFFPKVKIVPINYGDAAYKTVLDDFNFKNVDVIIADFSFDAKVMETIADIAHSVTWCDHHKTAIEKMKEVNFSKRENVYGLQSIKHSGAYLVWCWFFNNMKMTDYETKDNVPEIIEYVSKYDTFTFKRSEESFMYDIQQGMRALGITFDSECFDILLFELVPEAKAVDINKYQQLMNEIIASGHIVNEYNSNYLFKTYERHAYDVTVKVKGKNIVGVALNAPGYSQMFKYVYDKSKHFFMLKYCRLGNGQWVGSIYIPDDKINDVDASEIAITIAGEKNAGGHRGAAGFHTNSLPSFLK